MNHHQAKWMFGRYLLFPVDPSKPILDQTDLIMSIAQTQWGSPLTWADPTEQDEYRSCQKHVENGFPDASFPIYFVVADGNDYVEPKSFSLVYDLALQWAKTALVPNPPRIAEELPVYALLVSKDRALDPNAQAVPA